jgi:hypothetical protein
MPRCLAGNFVECGEPLRVNRGGTLLATQIWLTQLIEPFKIWPVHRSKSILIIGDLRAADSAQQ